MVLPLCPLKHLQLQLLQLLSLFFIVLDGLALSLIFAVRPCYHEDPTPKDAVSSGRTYRFTSYCKAGMTHVKGFSCLRFGAISAMLKCAQTDMLG